MLMQKVASYETQAALLAKVHAYAHYTPDTRANVGLGAAIGMVAPKVLEALRSGEISTDQIHAYYMDYAVAVSDPRTKDTMRTVAMSDEAVQVIDAVGEWLENPENAGEKFNLRIRKSFNRKLLIAIVVSVFAQHILETEGVNVK